MTRNLNNWGYREVTDFLTENGFRFLEPLKGSHQAWVKLSDKGEPGWIVEVSFRSDSYPVGTMKTMIKDSGIDEKRWRKWARS